MSGIEALSGSIAEQVATEIAIKVMKMADGQQQAAATLLEDALETAERIQETGKGERVDATA